MSDNVNEQDRLDSEMMDPYRLSAPAAGLRNRVLNAAHEAWSTSETISTEVSWVIPTFRLAASLAITLILVGFANIAERRSIARWQPVSRAAAPARTHSVSLDGEFARPFATLAAVPGREQSQRLRDCIQQLQKILDATES